MKKIYFLFFSACCFVTLKAQTTYLEAMKQGDEAYNSKQYKLAINKYFAAEAFDPSKKSIVKEKLNLTFDKIDALRQEAVNAKKYVSDALTEAQKQKQIADSALKEVQNEKQVAENALKEIIVQKNRADSSFKSLQELKKTVIGAGYQGGIIFYWSDKTGKHGLIAAENDLGEFKWQQAMDTCKKVHLNGYSDWRLPTIDELGSLYANANVIGGFELTRYWSSTEVNDAQAFCESFDYGRANNYAIKGQKIRVRLVRSF